MAKMELSVKTLDSQTHIFRDLDEEITVVEFKTLIGPIVALPPGQQRLIFRGRVLQDDKKLKEYNVTSGQVIHLVARNPTNTSTANDTPPQPATSIAGGGGGRNNAIIMGTIGTLEFPNGSGNRQAPRRCNSAAVRLTVANQSLSRASELLQSLEDDITVIQAQQQRSDQDTSGSEDNSTMVGIIGHHQATAVVATIEQRSQTEGGALAENAPAPGESAVASAASPMSGTGSEPANAASSDNTSARPQAPMLHELATSINDLVSFNTRLTPYLLTLQRWLTENEELGNNEASVQYTYNSISSIIHSLSHSLHALSDITIDFSLPPGQRRLRAPTSVWVDQSPMIRATIPIGVQVDVGVDTGPGNNAPNGSTTGTATQPQPQLITGQGTLPMGTGIQLQQAITNLIQGVMSGQAQQQQPSAQPPTRPGNPAEPNPATVQNGAQRPAPVNSMINSLGALLGPGVQISAAPVQPGGFQNPTHAQTPQTVGGVRILNHANFTGQGQTQNQTAGTRRATGFHHQLPQGPHHPHLHSFLDSLPPPMPRLDQMVLQCQSRHYAQNSNPIQRPENLHSFLSQENTVPVGAETQVFDTFVSLLQGLNVMHPVLTQYIRGTILRGRDANNPDHVRTGVRTYARRLVEWIVVSIAATREINSEALTSGLLEVVSKMLSQLTQVILSAQPGSSVTPSLGIVVSEHMPDLLNALGRVFTPPDHLRVFKGILLLIVTTCFPETSIVFTTQLTSGLARYLVACEPESSPQEEIDHGDTEEMSMEIDVEIEDVNFIDDAEEGIGRIPQPENVLETSINDSRMGSDRTGTEVAAESLMDSGSDSDDEALEAQYRDITNRLFQEIPEEWQPVLLGDIQRQGPLRNSEERQPLSPGFLSLFPQK